jgi:hypothetical protein
MTTYRIALNDTDVYKYDGPEELAEGVKRLAHLVDEGYELSIDVWPTDDDEYDA